MSDRAQSTATLQRIRDGLASASEHPNDWNEALREVLLEALRCRIIWFDVAAKIASSSDKSRQRALADLVVCMVFNSDLVHSIDA